MLFPFFRQMISFLAKGLLILCFLYLAVGAGHLAQAQQLRIAEIQQQVLRQLADDFSSLQQNQREMALRWAKARNMEARLETADGRIIELMYLDEQQLPVFYETRNEGAAFTTGARQLHFKGNLRLNLRGQQMQVGVWDGGSVLSTHPEFANRLTIKDGGVTSNHATHVAGTIGGSGLDTRAQGMAPEVSVLSYDWTDDLSEMATEASNGLIISNHSYGYVLGWGWDNGAWKWYAHNDSTYDYRFGYYGSKSRSLDQLANAAPHYLIVWAAGNDRNDVGNGTRPPDGPFDCIGPEGIAKNVLTVGAVQKLVNPYTAASDVVMSAFSSWGPADDGRVKPDLVGAGVSIYSATSGATAYGNMSGTSMATPNVTGSLILVQELYRQRHGGFMQAATLKGLAIHTVKETGVSAGPDYQFGWGLLDAEKAARMILFEDDQNFLIRELSLNNGLVYEMNFEADGSGDIVAVISWNDPAANPVAPALNSRHIMLVNDLDLRIYNQQGQQVFLPWKLDVENPSAEASRGDNIRDNVEKITIKNPEAGEYTLRVSHKGNLVNGKQDFALILQTRAVPQKQTFYWIGNSGLWSDPANWSSTSGGAPGQAIPGLDDHVVFDEKSFPNSQETTFEVQLDQPAAAYTFNWYSEKEVVIKGQNQALQVFGSMFIGAKNQLLMQDLSLEFTGNLPANEIFVGKKALETVKVSFTGSGGWRLMHDLHVASLELLDGDLDCSEVSLSTAILKVHPDYTRKLNLGGTQILGLQVFELNEKMWLQAERSSLHFQAANQGEACLLVSADHPLWDLENQNGDLLVEGASAFSSIRNAHLLRLSQDTRVNDLQLKGGSELKLQPGMVLELKHDFILMNEESKTIKIRSEGGPAAVIRGTAHKKFCLDFMDIQGVVAEGQALFNAGLNSHLDNLSTGWHTRDCNELVFADFSYTFACVGGLTHFKNLSSGTIDMYLWDFDPQGASTTSSDTEPYFTFPQTGLFPVSLLAQAGNENSQVTKMVEVTANPLNKGNIVVSGTKYTSSATAPKYQWFLDGKPIPNANSRNYFNEDGKGGVYQVMIHNDVCNMVSEPLVVTRAQSPLARIEGIRVYPNPVQDYLQINLEGVRSYSGKLRIQLLDQRGRVIITEAYQSLIPHAIIPTSELPAGIYVLRIILDDRTHSEKVVVQ